MSCLFWNQYYWNSNIIVFSVIFYDNASDVCILGLTSHSGAILDFANLDSIPLWYLPLLFFPLFMRKKMVPFDILITVLPDIFKIFTVVILPGNWGGFKKVLDPVPVFPMRVLARSINPFPDSFSFTNIFLFNVLNKKPWICSIFTVHLFLLR